MSTNSKSSLNKASTQVVFPPQAVLAVGILAVSTAAIFIRLAQREATSMMVAAARLTLASLALLPFAWRRRDEYRAIGRRKAGFLVLAGFLLALHFALWITSLEMTSVASSVVLVTTTPLWVALLSPVVLRERLTRAVWIGLGVALAGGILVGLSEACSVSTAGLACPPAQTFFQGKAMLGNLLALGGAFAAAGYMTVGRLARQDLSLLSYITAVYGAAAIFLVAAAGASGQFQLEYSPVTWLCFAGLALIPQLVGHSSLNYALRFLPAAYVSVSLLAEPIGSSLLAILLLKEAPSVLEVTGGLIILIGIGLATWKRE